MPLYFNSEAISHRQGAKRPRLHVTFELPKRCPRVSENAHLIFGRSLYDGPPLEKYPPHRTQEKLDRDV